MYKVKLDLDRPIWEPPEVPPSLPAVRPADHVKPKGWGERARELLTSASVITGATLAEVPMTCGVHFRPFIAEVELRKDVLIFVRNRLTDAGNAGGGAPMRQESLGQFRRFEARRGWSCRHCNARENPAVGIYLAWQCCGNWMCAGSIDRSAYCACGAFRELRFSGTPDDSYRWEVGGTRASQRRVLAGPPEVPRIAAGRAASRQITTGEPPLRLPWTR
jgi:hypothetical protein